jgi:uncharacterized Zn-finger protein
MGKKYVIDCPNCETNFELKAKKQQFDEAPYVCPFCSTDLDRDDLEEDSDVGL